MKWFAAILAIVLGVGMIPGASAQAVRQIGPAISSATLAQYGGRTIQCESLGRGQATCSVPWRGPTELMRQVSHSPCIEGRTWGSLRGAVWVDGGCRAIFREVQSDYRPPHHGGPGGWQPGPGWDTTIRLRCGSPQYQYNFCAVDTGRGSRVFLNRQLSDTRCIEGRNWGWNRGGIWVDRGCAGEFVVERRWR